MIKIEQTEVFGWNAAIRGMRNPMNSWNKSDSDYDWESMVIGPNDLELMKRLRKSGTEHRKFLRMIVVYADITAPLYWWKEFDTYKVGTVANSCSTMHKIAAKEFTLEDFSYEHLRYPSKEVLLKTIEMLNEYRVQYEVNSNIRKEHWWQMIQLLPSSYNQRRTVMLNYEVLTNIYTSRKNHKLDEWVELCQWIEALPCSEIITLEKGEEHDRK